MEKLSTAISIMVAIATGLASHTVVAGPKEDLALADSAYQRGDFEKALGLIRPLAEQGDADAQAYLGSMYAQGTGVPKDYDKALALVRPLAEQGNANAQMQLAFMYEEGHGVSADMTEAFKWMRRAANQGNSFALTVLGAWYTLGKGDVPKDRAAKSKWLLGWAQEGDKAAQAILLRAAKTKEFTYRLFMEFNGVPPVDTPSKPYKWAVGMTKKQVLESVDGAPQRVNKTTILDKTTEQWIYSGGSALLYFNQNDVLIAIQERR